MKKFPFLWPIKALRYVLGIIVTTLFLPLIELFFMMISCAPNADGVMTNTVAPSIVCWQGIRALFYAVSAVFIIVVFVGVSVIVVITYYDVSADDKGIEAKATSSVDVYRVCKEVLSQSFIFSSKRNSKYYWFLLRFLLVWSSSWILPSCNKATLHEPHYFNALDCYCRNIFLD